MSSVTNGSEEGVYGDLGHYATGIALHELVDSEVVGNTVLPYGIEPNGFVADTLFYGALWWCCVLAIRRLRRVSLSRRSIISGAVALITLGAITNVAVAWWCEFYVDVEVGPGKGVLWSAYDGQHFSSWSYEQSDGFGGTRIDSNWFRPNPWDDNPRARIHDKAAWAAATPYWSVQTNKVGDLALRVPTWARRTIPAEIADAERYRSFVFDARGWPMLSFSGGFEWRSILSADFGKTIDREIIKTYGCIVPRGRHFDELSFVQNARILPLTPVWPGFLIKSIA